MLEETKITEVKDKVTPVVPEVGPKLKIVVSHIAKQFVYQKGRAE